MALSNAKPITPGSNDRKGLDFAEWFDDPGLPAVTLRRLAEILDPVVAFCLRLNPVHGGYSTFEPYGLSQGLNGLANLPSLNLPPSIGYERLLMPNDTGGEEWPLIAEWFPGTDPPDHPPEIKGSPWIGQMRLQSFDNFVGYFKVSVSAGQRVARHQNKRFADAFEELKDWLPLVIHNRREQQKKLNPDYQAALARIHTIVARRVFISEPREAMQALCTLLTSHVGGAGFNRCIFIAGINSVTEGASRTPIHLKSVFAMGGDCSPRWADLQNHIASNVQSISQLASLIESQRLPDDDPLFSELVTGPHPLTIDVASPSVVAQLWRHRGDLTQLSSSSLIEISGRTEISWPDLLVKEDLSTSALAAVISGPAEKHPGDPLFQQWKGRIAQSVLLANHNSTWFVIPMVFADQCLGMMLCDLGQWDNYNIIRDVVPRLLTVRALIDVFAHHFATVNWS